MPFAGGTRRNPMAELLALSQGPAAPAAPQRRQRKPRQAPFNPFAAPPPPPEVIETPAEPFGMRDYAAMGVRGLGGMLGIGALPGAAAGAGSEAIASLIEGDNLLEADTLKEIAAAGALGASGGGVAKMVSAGAGPLQALLRGGALSAGGEAASEYIRDEELDPTSIATAGALGGGAAAGMSALLRKLGVNLPPGAKTSPAKPSFEVEMTAGPGMQTPQGQPNIPSTLGGGPLKRTLMGSGDDIKVPPARSMSGQEYDDIYARHGALIDNDVAGTLTADELAEARLLDKQLRDLDFQRPADVPSASRTAFPDAGGLSPRATRAITAEQRALEAQEKAAQKLLDQQAAQDRIDAATAGMRKGTPSVSESVSVPIEGGGKRRLTQKFVKPKKGKSGSSEAGFTAGGAPPISPVAPLAAAPRVADDLGELLGVVERRSGSRTPELDAFYQAERQGVNPLGVQGGKPAKTVEQMIDEIDTMENQRFAAEAAPLGREAQSADDIAFQLADEEPIKMKERRETPRLPEDEAYTRALQSGASPEDAEAIRAQVGYMRRSSEQRSLEAPPTAALPEAAPIVAAPTGASSTVPLAALLKTPGDVANEHYRALKAVFGQGESGLPAEVAPQVQRIAQNKVAGRAAKRIGDAEAAPTAVEAAIPAAAPAPPAEAPRFGAKASEGLKKFFMEQEGRPSRSPLGPGGFGSRAGGEGGFVNPELAASMGLGAIGAIGGAALDPLGNPLMSGLLGGAAGAALPQLASKISSMAPTLLQSGQVDPETGQLLQQIGTPQGLSQTLMDMVRTLPAVQRGMLLSNPNIFNNALVGPYGAGISFGLERALAGDPRGWEVLRQMSPKTFTQNYINSWGEASRLIGDAERAGGQMLGEAANKVEYVAALPGTFMAGGDLAARKAIMAAGFTEAEARLATLTSEPETRFGKSIVNMQRSGGPLAQMALPFARTIVNLGEQGTRRIPGIGYLAQATRENPDPIGVQHIQQLLGGGALLGGYAAGDQMEELADALPGERAGNMRLLRSFLSNATGPNATLATMGLAAGRAAGSRKDPLQQVGAALKAGIQETPLPTTAPAEDIIDFATAEPGNRRLPRSVVPGIVRDELNELLFGTGSNQGGRRKRRTRAREER